jgi:hypothetical protein
MFNAMNAVRAPKFTNLVMVSSAKMRATTKNEQLKFLQHVKTLLEIIGGCAIVIPDNVLFEGGAGRSISSRLPIFTGYCHTLALSIAWMYRWG